MSDAAAIEAAFIAACRAEIEAPKPGNVHILGAGHGMTTDHFLLSATVAAKPLCDTRRSVGERIYDAVAASFEATRMNTNLGIVLLCAPLAAAAESAEKSALDLRAELARTLAALDVADTRQVFAAIRLANPGGLGTASRYDIHGPANVGLLVAMAEAAERDRIALQYVSNFDDVFMTGLIALAAARAADLAPPWTTVAVYLTFLSTFPDSHIMRKHGLSAAYEVQAEASQILGVFHAKRDACISELLGFDARLKSHKRNPGTSADLTVATLFADRLYSILLKRRNDG